MWAIRGFNARIHEQNAVVKSKFEKCPIDILATNDNKQLCHRLCAFVTEVTKSNGSEYTSRSITSKWPIIAYQIEEPYGAAS